MNKKVLLKAIIVCLTIVLTTQVAAAWTINGGSYRSLSSYEGIKTFDYAATPVRESVLPQNMVGAEYSFKTGSKDIDEYFGVTKDFVRGDEVYKGFYLNKNSKGKCGVRYNKLFQYGDTWVDVKTTYMNWKVSNSSKAFVYGGFCKIRWIHVNWIKLKHEFFVAGTNEPIEVKGFFTFADVDDNQGFILTPAEIGDFWVNSAGTTINYKKEDGLLIIKDGAKKAIPSLGQPGYDKAIAAKATFSYTFSGKAHNQYILDGNNDSSFNIIEFESAKAIPSNIPSAGPPSVEKTVSDEDESDVHENTILQRDEEWTYQVAGAVPLETETGNFYYSFAFYDQIDENLEIKEITIIRGAGTDVTDNFEISTEGNLITAQARNVKTDSFYGYTYFLNVRVGIRPDAVEVPEEFVNRAKVIYEDGNGTYERDTNEVKTIIKKEVPPAEEPEPPVIEAPETISIEGTKIWQDVNDHDGIRPSKVNIYLLRDGQRIDGMATDESKGWKYSFDNLPKYQGDREIVYRISEERIDGYEMISLPTGDVVNVHIPYEIVLTKLEKTEDGLMTDRPVMGAVYRVTKIEDEEGLEISEFVGEFVTDDEGKLKVRGIDPGLYRFEEITVPYGYMSDAEVVSEGEGGSEISAGGDYTDVKVEKYTGQIGEVCVTQVGTVNQRKPAKVTVIKRDDAGKPVEGAVFGLYSDSDCSNLIKEGCSGDTSIWECTGLSWGTYYLKEIEAPKGYVINSDTVEIVLGKDTTIDRAVSMVNERKKGTVQLIKTGETEDILLEGAEFSLFTTDGRLIKDNLITDENGIVEVCDLEWGSYYFSETGSPEGYGISDKPIRFSVDATSADAVQQVRAMNKPKISDVAVTKKIKVSDIHYDHGNPTFMFRLQGQDIDGMNVGKNSLVSFNRQYVEANTDVDGYVSMTTVFAGLKAGSYRCTEIDADRYEPEQKYIEFELDGETDKNITFVNEKTDWRDYSHTATAVNIVDSRQKLTGIVAEYEGPQMLEGNAEFDRSNLKVTAVYDDGKSRLLADDEYELLFSGGDIFERIPRLGGEYVISARYEEDSILRQDTFVINVADADMVNVSFISEHGAQLGSITTERYNCLADLDDVDVSLQENGYEFLGWFLDENCHTPFHSSIPIIADVTLYGGWRGKHLGECSWEEINAISESGKAEEIFGECFNAVKDDLSEGTLEGDTYIHTKAFDHEGNSYHGIIAGFDSDEITGGDGTKAGMTFFVYEPMSSSIVGTEAMEILYDQLPQELREHIKSIDKPTASKDGEGVWSITSNSNRIWLPSQVELYGAWGYDRPQESSIYAGDTDFGELHSLAGEGRQYSLFAGLVPDGSPLSEITLARGYEWFTRSPAIGIDGYCTINSQGAASTGR